MPSPLSDLTCERIDLDGRPHWLFADGSTLPVVSGGMTDVAPAEPTAAEADGAGDVSGDGGDADLSDEEMDQAFTAIESDPQATPQSKAEVKRLRAQVARQREATKAYGAFDRFHPDDRAFLMETVSALVDNPAAATENMAVLLQTLWGDRLPAVLEQLGLTPAQAAAVERKADAAADGEEEGGWDPTDPEQLQAYIDYQFQMRDQQQQEAAAKENAIQSKMEEIHSTLRELGFTNPTSEEARLVLSTAQHVYDFDIRKAYKALTARGLRVQPAAPAGAEAPARPAPTAEAAGGPVESGQGGYVSRDDLIRRAEKRVEQRFGAPRTPTS